MLSEELLKQVRRIEISTRKVVNDMMSGQYKSHFKGHGVQFSEHRVYSHGDDIRHIDWKVSARSKEPHIKKYEEERELTVLLLVDISGSESFGSSKKLKSEISAEIGGMLAFAATQTGDKVGVLLFAEKVEKTIVPQKGRKHVLRVIRDLLGFQPTTKGTNFVDALDSARRVLKHSGVVFIISDFISSDYGTQLKRLARKHDVVAIWVSDPRENLVPPVGWVTMEDPESGDEFLVDTDSYAFKTFMKEEREDQTAATQALLQQSRVEVLKIHTHEDHGEAVVRFFKARKRLSG